MEKLRRVKAPTASVWRHVLDEDVKVGFMLGFTSQTHWFNSRCVKMGSPHKAFLETKTTNGRFKDRWLYSEHASE